MQVPSRVLPVFWRPVSVTVWFCEIDDPFLFCRGAQTDGWLHKAVPESVRLAQGHVSSVRGFIQTDFLLEAPTWTRSVRL